MSQPISTSPTAAANEPSPPKHHKRMLLKKLCLMLVTFMICIGLAEVALRLLEPVRAVGPMFTTYHPLYGKVLKKNYANTRTTPGYTYRVTTNSLGFRGPDPASPPKDVVLFIGDSMTMGTGVNDGEEYPDLVRRWLAEQFGEDKIAVVNAAMANNGNGRWVKFLRTGAEQFEPRFVFLQVAFNDFRDNVKERLFKLSESGQLQELAVPPRDALDKLQPIIESVPGLSHSYLLSLARQVAAKKVVRRSKATNTDPNRRDRLTYLIIEESLKICQQRRWPVAAITVEIEGDHLQRLQELFRRYNAPLIHVPYKHERPDLYFTFDRHWNVDGHSWVADAVHKHLLADPRFDATTDTGAASQR